MDKKKAVTKESVTKTLKAGSRIEIEGLQFELSEDVKVCGYETSAHGLAQPDEDPTT